MEYTLKDKNNIEKFEHLLKKEVSNQQITPPADVWSSIASQSGSFAGSYLSSQITSYIANLSSVVKIAILSGVVATVGILTYNGLSDNTSKTPASPETTKTTENILPEKSITAENSEEEQATQTSTNKATPGKTGDFGFEESDQETVVTSTPEIGNNEPVPSVIEKVNSDENTENSTTLDKNITIVLPGKHSYCVGEYIDITNSTNTTGNWLINGIWFKERSSVRFKVPHFGVHHVEFHKGSDLIASANFKAEDAKAQIVQEETSEKVYNFSLSNSLLTANWFIDGKQIGTNTPSVKHIVNKPGAYSITANITNSSCFTEPVNYHLQVKSEGNIEFFDFFSPNGDGKNDQYLVNISGYEHFRIQIVDLNNALVFESTNPAIGWNGRRLDVGEHCPDGEYIAKISYQLQGESLKTKTLRITLIRN